MDFLRILSGKELPLPIYSGITACLENPLAFPDLLEPIYREAMKLDDDTLDRFRFSLMRLQLYADVHRNEDLEKAKIKLVDQLRIPFRKIAEQQALRFDDNVHGQVTRSITYRKVVCATISNYR